MGGADPRPATGGVARAAASLTPDPVLVIKLGALGDFVQAFPAFAAIRAHHPDAPLTLLTTSPFAGLARRSPWFDAVWENGRPGWADLPAVWRLARRLRGAGFGRVYDLQTAARTALYRRALPAATEWSGIARGASHRDPDPARATRHVAERHRRQLAVAGILRWPAPTLEWLDDPGGLPTLPGRFVLLAPGASAHRPGKRWPVGQYAGLAAALDVPAVVVGGAAEAPLATAIRSVVPATLDLTGATPLPRLAALARRAVAAVGNDTGPVHLIAATGCPTLVLFGADSDPAFCAPLGPQVQVLRQAPLATLPVTRVLGALDPLLRRGPAPGGGAGGSALSPCA